MTPEVPPRLHVLMAREARTGVIFRKGPSRQVACYHWDRKTDKITLGQWLKGRIYWHRSDLSPDGRHMIYFAINGKYNSPVKGTWTAISRPPYLTALHVYPKGDSWNGGGLFTDNDRYWLNEGPWPHEDNPEFHVASAVKRDGQAPLGITAHGGEDLQIYLPKLARDGWEKTGQVVEPNHQASFTFHKQVRPKWTMQKIVYAGAGTGPLGQCYWEEHLLTGPGQIIDGKEWEWADVDHRRVVFASKGALWQQIVHAKRAEDPQVLFDFNGTRFENRKAPYEGIRRKSNTGEKPMKDQAE